MTNKEKQRAIMNAKPLKPVRVELGGGYYYRCHWIACNNTVNTWDRYCSQCGQRLYWDNDYDEGSEEE